MKVRSTKSTALLDIALVAAIIAILGVLVNKNAFPAPVYTALLFGLLLAAAIAGWWREARKEEQLDELDLASASFGARWGVAVLGMVALLILFVAPLHDAIIWFDQAYENNRSRPLPAPVGVFLIGFMFAYFLQLTAKSALGAIWKWTKR